MSMLTEATERHGIAASYEGADGRLIKVPEETLRLLLSALDGIPAPEESQDAPKPPAKCFLPDFLHTGRAWGISLQLYELRSRRNAGIGDFADLADFCRVAGAMGADFIGCSPVHALFTANANRCSPFFPSNRRFINPLYIALDRAPGVTLAAQQVTQADQLRDRKLVDYEAVCRLKLSALYDAWCRWPNQPGAAEHEFVAFQAEAGDSLRKHALFEVLSGFFTERGHDAGWRSWPQPFQDSRSSAVDGFAQENEDSIRFHMWLQWIADVQLREAAATARRSGMRIGLYLDLAVAEAPDGSATWSEPDNFLPHMKIGAPPDVFSAEGQDWGLAPLSPAAFSGTGLRSYQDLIGLVMRPAGALRIDHAMALRRLFLIPEDAPARCGTYVRYPMPKIISCLITASHRSETIVIGEDLGNVPQGFRGAMEAAGILSYRVLCFEHRDGKFLPAAVYPALALACVTTHDLPPLRGWWNAEDIALRHSHGLIDEAAAASQRSERESLKASLLRVLRAEGKLAEAVGQVASWQSLALSVHRFIAATPSLLVAARLADMTGEMMPTNIPGIAESYPNWRLKSSLTVEAFAQSDMANAITGVMAEARPR